MRYLWTAVWLTLILTCCAKKDPNVPLSSLTEAYQLLDRGENAKAILVLEQYLAKEPNSEEGKLLLASAYMGLSGINIFSAHDAFKDILFDRPLIDKFFKDQPDKHPLEKPAKQTPLEIIIDKLDTFLNKTRQALVFLNRFPDVEKKKWPFLDRALEALESTSNGKDIALYRVFTRVVYLRAFLDQEILKDKTFGSRQWLCTLDLDRFRDSLTWTLRQLVSASNDFLIVYPKEASHFSAAHSTIAGVMKSLEDHAPPGTRTGLHILQGKMRELLRCPE